MSADGFCMVERIPAKGISGAFCFLLWKQALALRLRCYVYRAIKVPKAASKRQEECKEAASSAAKRRCRAAIIRATGCHLRARPAAEAPL